ncbi:redox-sensing transcriptional repressor [Desulfomicrobium apsheronum]|uniref:Redox-sensing transcriptional repressor Rex n=1 Tax=Desulfomicrobium apsheronum TaxID=52560 RepID=A0A1I3TB56_9BACT|nr:redox-sensing transcriptional repressor Rex [Desulfomicrobium apsheronum]SFJ68408.1 redox-sensing transcriptional repressor [Desulfomicrobium apsheronum]
MANTKKRPRIDKKNLIIRRMSTYLRTLDHLQNKGVKVISSADLEKIDGVTQSLVRRDFAEFGSFGVRGVGYHVPELREQIARVLGFDRHWKVALIGAGGLGSVLMHSASFKKRNLEVVQIFDHAGVSVGTSIEGIPVHDIANIEQELDASRIDLAIIAVPPPEVQSVIDRLSQLGVRGALYFASRPVRVPENMVVLNMDITVELGVLTYQLQDF